MSDDVRNSFISTLDHLPCDIVRSLWIIQSLNIGLDEQLNRFQQLMKQIQTCGKDPELMSQLMETKTAIHMGQKEAIEEANTIKRLLLNHKSHLKNELKELETIAKTKSLDQELERRRYIDYYATLGLTKKITIKIPGRLKQKFHQISEGRESLVDTAKSPAVTKPSTIKLRLVAKPPTKKVSVAVAENKPIVKKKKLETEPTYCFCNDVSYGQMVGCDNEKCKIEWFHYKCVGLNKAPVGKWYCPDCRKKFMPTVMKPAARVEKKPVIDRRKQLVENTQKKVTSIVVVQKRGARHNRPIINKPSAETISREQRIALRNELRQGNSAVKGRNDRQLNINKSKEPFPTKERSLRNRQAISYSK